MDEKGKQYMQIDDIEIRPWTHGQLLKLLPTLENIISQIEEKDLTIEKIMSLQKNSKELVHIVFQFLPFLTPIVSITIDVSEEEIEKWDFDKVAKIGLAIIVENVVKLKAFVTMGNKALKTLN